MERTPSSELEEEIEQAFRDWWDAPSDYDGGISDYMLPLVRKAQAEALREAAADNETGWALRTWLNNRADRIEQNSEGNET